MVTSIFGVHSSALVRSNNLMSFKPPRVYILMKWALLVIVFDSVILALSLALLLFQVVVLILVLALALADLSRRREAQFHNEREFRT